MNTASVGGLVAGPLAGPYAASKSAVVALSKGLIAKAMRGANVGVTVVCPGKVDNPILGRVNQRPGAAPHARLPICYCESLASPGDPQPAAVEAAP